MKILFGLLILACSLTAQAFTFTLDNPRFYAGMDGHYRTIEMPREFGGNVFSKYFPGMNCFIGNRLTDNLGIEVGYHSTNNKTSQAVVGRGEKVLGVLVKGSSQHHISKASISGYYLNLNAYYPLFDIADNNLEATGYVGVSQTKIRYKNLLAHANGVPQDINSAVLVFNANKPVLRAGIGFQYNYCHCAIRLMVNYENLNTFNKVKPYNNPKDYLMKLRDSFHVGLGFVTYLN